MRLSPDHLRLVTSFIFMSAIYHSAAETCEELRCRNGNVCQAVRDGNGNVRYAACVCGGQWAGPLCSHRIHLQPQHVTASQASFTLNLVMSNADDEPHTPSSPSSSALSLEPGQGESGDAKLNYTLVYWQRNDTVTSSSFDSTVLTSGEVTCVLLHQREKRETTVRGLLPRTLYTVCVENGWVDSCMLASLSDAFERSVASLPALARFTASRTDMTSPWPSNCVTILTPSASASGYSVTQRRTVTAVAVASVFILTTLVIVFVVFLLRRESGTFRLFVDGLCQRYCSCCTCCQCGTGEEWDGSEEGLSGSGTVVSQCDFHTGSSLSPPDVATPTDFSPHFPVPPQKRSTLVQMLKRRREKKKKEKKKKEKSSSYATANMLLPPSATPRPGPFMVDEASPLDCEEAHCDALDLDDDESEGQGDARASTSEHVLPGIHKGRGKGHRLSRKRRGYVAYTAKKDGNIKLTTVMETPLDDIGTVSDGVEMTI